MATAKKMTAEQAEKTVAKIVKSQNELAMQELELMNNPQFREFQQHQKEVNAMIADYWKKVEEGMIENNIKSIKGDFGSVTVAERTDFDIDYDELPAKFYKKVVDTKKIADTYKLTGKAPKGTTPKIKKYLTKRLKAIER